MEQPTSNPQEVIVFGGSFNPPTRAHESIIRTCMQQPGFDEVWVMPSGDRDDKHMASSDADRLAMLEALKQDDFGNDPRLQISDFELRLPQPTQTIRTVGALALAYPRTNFWFVYGADSYASMPEWENGQELQQNLSVLLLPREGTPLPSPSPNIRYLIGDLEDAAAISSTKVREAVGQRQDFAPFVSNAVRKYIQARKLYSIPAVQS